LSLLEHGAYTLLLDHYYATGKPIEISNASLLPDHSRVYRLCSAATKEEKEAVDSVLEMFFELTDEGYINAKAAQVIVKQQAAHERRVNAGRKGGSSNAKAKPKQSSRKPEPEPEVYNNSKGGAEKKRVTLKELEVEHITEWLQGKRAGGKYLTIDEHRLLEMFKDYCQSKGKQYKDYVAAYRNAFEWHNAPKKGTHNENNRHGQQRAGKSDQAKAAIMRGID
jgi:uncharacterized protein YdaU (DUF1376 family)